MPEEVYIGRKPVKVYFIKASFALSKQQEVSLISRGALISKALVVAKRLQDACGAKLEIDKITFDELESKNGKKKIVPSISIKLKLK